MNSIGINVNTKKDPDGKILDYVTSILYQEFKGIKVKVFNDSMQIKGAVNEARDLMIVLGGDGTILSTSREIAQFGIPIFGVNFGHLGFLTEVEAIEFREGIREIFKGNYFIEERMMLNCSVNGVNSSQNIALNDVVIAKGTLSRIAKYDIEIDENYYTSFAADGIIISTPTGSTAYSLSAGGPIIYPNLNLVSITPICPHSMGIRTLILDGNSKISIKVRDNNEEIYLTFDGQVSLKLKEANEIRISSSKFKCKLIKLNNYNYFDILRKKLLSQTSDE